MKRLLLTVLLLGVSLFVGCGGNSGSGGVTPPPAPTLVSIAISPASSSIVVGSTQQFSATGTYSDGSTKAVAANWLSATPSVATINTSGLATGVAAGTSMITATSGSISGQTTLTVTNPLVSIAVTPSPVTLPVKAQQAFTATGTYADHSTQIITSSVTWQSSNPGVAAINSAGLAVAQAVGSVTITATSGSVSGTASLTVTNPLISIAVTPLTVSIASSTTQQFTATGTYADSSTSVITSTVTWASSNPAFATISNSPGTQGLASALTAGTTAITATLGSVTSPPATLTVTSATLTSIAVTPVNAVLVYQSTPQQYTATGTFSDSTTQDITGSVTWTSSDTTKVAIVASGLATGVGVTSSPVTITATKGTVSGSTTATVVPPPLVSIAITPSATTADTTLAQGTSRQYFATGTRTNGSTLNITNLATWTSSDITIATVGQHTGTVAAKAVSSSHNPVTITVTYSGVTQTLVLDVTNATVTAVTVTPITSTIPVGVQQVFAATATFSDSSTQDISLNASWTSSDITVATVNPFGRASSLKPGPATITATFGGQSGTAQLTVSTATLQSITISPATTVLAPASTLNYQAIGTYSDLSTQYLSAIATWSSSDTTKVTITPHSGVATGQSAGQANITAAYQGVTSNAGAVVVEQFPLVSISILPATASVPEGVGIPFTATGTFQDGSTQNLTSSVTWATGQSSVATISNAPGQQQGLATGVAPGQSSITAVFAGIVGNASLTVTNATIMSIAITPANPSVTAGTQVSFTATGTFSDGSSVNLTNQVTWSSSNATVATIVSNGQANTAAPGTTTITATFTQNGVSVPGSTILTVH